jgi:RNA recognition motif-containing protein
MNRPLGPPPNFMMSKIPTEMAPVTKVFVGNISERAPDPMMRQMLQRCGNVINWKRVEGANGKLQAFGFVEYDNPQYTLRCIRLLNGYQIAEKKLLVKVDQKTRELLGEYLRKTRRDDKGPLTKNAKKAASLRSIGNKNSRNAEDGELDDDESMNDNKNINLELVDEDTLKEDRIALGALELILKQYSKDLNPPEPVPVEKTAAAVPVVATTAAVGEADVKAAPANTASSQEETTSTTGVYMKPHLRLEEIQLDDDKKDLIKNEINIFREKHKVS